MKWIMALAAIIAFNIVVPTSHVVPCDQIGDDGTCSSDGDKTE